jgi:Predicted signal transduction protein with a C-terminal ATPase domain
MKFHKSIRLKFLCCLLAISILPVLIIFIFTLKSNAQFYQSQVTEASNNEVRTITTRVNGIMENLNRLLTSLIFSKYDNDSCMMSICDMERKGNTPTPYERLCNYRKFEYVCSNLIANNEYAEGVYLFNQNGYTYSFVKNRELGLEENYKESTWYKSLSKSDSLPVTALYHSNKVNDDKVAFARYFTDVKGRYGSVLAVVCNDKIFDNNLAWGEGFVMDENGNIIHGTITQKLTKQERNQIINNERGVIFQDKKENNYIFGTLSVNNWKIVSEISIQPLNKLYQKSTRYLLGIIAIILIFITLLLVISERVIIRPLVKLAQIMKNTKAEKPFKHIKRERDDEIGVLYRGYEKMIGEINTLIQEKYVSEIQFLKSKLKNLMSQINAHFIFNTLENINCLAEIEKNRQIGIMSKSLGDMLRYSIEYEKDEEKLSTEIEHIKQYIQIQEIRFGNHIFLEQEIEDGLEQAKVLKFMLQPVIENAIEHGLAGEDVPWIIHLKAYKEEDNIIIWIQDNGIGMSNENLLRITNQIQHSEFLSEDSRYTSIGLSNIHKRIQLLYSENYGLHIENPSEEGVKVTICLPYHLE